MKELKTAYIYIYVYIYMYIYIYIHGSAILHPRYKWILHPPHPTSTNRSNLTKIRSIPPISSRPVNTPQAPSQPGFLPPRARAGSGAERRDQWARDGVARRGVAWARSDGSNLPSSTASTSRERAGRDERRVRGFSGVPQRAARRGDWLERSSEPARGCGA
jgi:hypothetical protein